MKNQLLVFLISCLFVLQITPLQNKLKISNDFIDLFHQVKNDETFNTTAVREAIQYVDDKTMETRVKNNAYNAYMGEILNEYAKKLFYGKLTHGNPEIQKAFLFFKLAAKHGNAESLYYLSFYSFYNLDGRFLFKNSFDNLEDSDKTTQLVNFIKNMNSTTVMDAAQHSSVQGYDPAKFLLGNLYLKGRGVPANCAKAGFYFKELGNKLISEGLLSELDVSDITEKKRLDDLYFSLEPENSVLPLKDNLQEQQYLVMSADLGEVPKIMELAYTYYYGLKGEKRDYQKAFEYFRKAASRGDLGAKVRVGKMLIKGLGVDKDVQTGIKYLEDAEKQGDPRAKNALGELYKLGEGVPMNQTVALNYFKEAAEKDNFSAAIYNYGASLMSTDPAQIENGFQLVTLAAQQGHPLALYHTGLQYFHNSQIQNGCEMGAFLMKVGLERGPWSDKLKEGYYAYQKKQYKLAALLYMEAALLGSDTGAVNAALIIDEFKVFNDYDLDGTRLEQEMLMDSIWIELSSTYSYKPPKDIQRFIHEDLSNVLSTLKYSDSKTGVILQTLGQTNSEASSNYRKQLVLKLLKLGAEDLEPLSLVVLGDSYQTGKLGEKDDKKAYDQYSQVISVVPLNHSPTIISHTLYNLGYMNHHGLGTQKNLTKAIHYYNLTERFDKKGSYLAMVNKKLAEWEKDIYGEEIPNALEGKDKVEMDEISLIKGLLRRFEERYIKKIMLGFLILGALILYLAKMRLENYVNLSVSEEKRR